MHLHAHNVYHAEMEFSHILCGEYSLIESCLTPTDVILEPCDMENGCVMPGYEELPIWNRSCTQHSKREFKHKVKLLDKYKCPL